MSDNETLDMTEIDKLFKLMVHSDEPMRKQGYELFVSLLEAEDPAALARMGQAALLENGQLIGDVPWCDALFEVFFAHPKLQLEPSGKRKRADVLALDLSFLAAQEGRLTSLSWLRLVPNLKRLIMPCQVLNNKMLDQLESLQHLETLNLFGCSFPMPLRPKLSALAGGGDSGYSLKNSDDPPGIGIFFQCNTTDINVISARSYRIGSVALTLVHNNRLHRVYFITEGYSGGGDQGQGEVRLDFHPDGTISVKASSWYDAEEYEYSGQVFPEEDELVYEDMPELDVAIFRDLRHIIWKHLTYDEEQEYSLPIEATLNRINDDGIWIQGAFDTSLFFGLARNALGLNTYWNQPNDVADRLGRVTYPAAWQAYADAKPAATFLWRASLEDTIDQLIDIRDDVSYDDEGTPKFEALIADATASLQNRAEDMAQSLGWTLQEKRVIKEKYGESTYFCFQGDGWMYDYDAKLMAYTKEHNCHLQIWDLGSDIYQGYSQGYYDTGSISHPQNLGVYTDWVKKTKAQIAAQAAQ